jgi:hypothetical protein
MKKLSYIILGCILLASCNTKKNNSQEEQDQKVIHDIDLLLQDLPDPSAVAFTLKTIEADFADSLLNNQENLEKYRGNIDKLSINMGVYAADVNYLACYGKKDLTMEYAKLCHTIGEILGDSAIFTSDLLSKIESSLSNEEELAHLLRTMIVQTSVTLEKDHHLSMAALALAGTYIEEMYHAVNIIDNYHSDDLTREEVKVKIEPLVRLVLDQEKPLIDLIELLNDIPHDDFILNLLTELNILDRLYKGELAVIEENLNSDPNYVLNRDHMYGITLEIERIRAEIIK